jgi:hypothetical protein
MKNLSLAPFKPGDKVVAGCDFPAYKKGGFNTPTIGQTYTVRSIKIMQGNSGYSWYLTLDEVVNKVIKFKCGGVGEVHWAFWTFKKLDENVSEEKKNEVIGLELQLN